MESRLISPTERGQITIPKGVREELGITPNTKFKIYVDNKRVVLEPVSTLDTLFKELELEAKEKGYTREELNKEIEATRERLYRKLYGDGANND